MNEPSTEQRALAAVERERDELRAEVERLLSALWDSLMTSDPRALEGGCDE